MTTLKFAYVCAITGLASHSRMDASKSPASLKLLRAFASIARSSIWTLARANCRRAFSVRLKYFVGTSAAFHGVSHSAKSDVMST